MIGACDIDWQAAATAFTGVLAVGAALIVGKKQNKILHRQSELAEMAIHRQSELAEMAIRSDIFDRRFQCYRNCTAILGEILRSGGAPSHDFEVQFLTAKQEASFLFSDDLNAMLEAMWRDITAYRAVTMETEHSYKTTGSYGPGLDRQHRLFEKIAGYISSVADAFRQEMNLTKGTRPGKMALGADVKAGD